MSINVTISAVNDLSKPLKIKYMQNTTAIPIVVTFTEYTIPTGSQARIYLEKTSGLKVYNNCDIKDNSIVINPSEQLFAEYGRQIAQLQIITADKKILVSKAIMFDIQEDTTSSGAIESTNEFTVLVKATEEARMSLAEASEATLKANDAASRTDVAIANTENATLLANTAATKADTAATTANTAATKAEAATNETNNAISKANTAANNAENATTNANAVILAAEKATQSATTATNQANTAATNANNAKTATELATAQANEATAKANNVGKDILTLDDFKGTDGEKLQQCFTALKNIGGVITITRSVNLDRNILIDNNSDLNTQIVVKGIGKSSKINMNGFHFYGVNTVTGGVAFDGIEFVGTDYCFDVATLIRLRFNNCYFNGFVNVFNSTNYAQSLYITNCVFRTISNYILSLPIESDNTHVNKGVMYDLKMSSSLVERCGGVLSAGSVIGSTITANCIEGNKKDLIYLKYWALAFNVSENYFEKNVGKLIDMSTCSEWHQFNINIINNLFDDTTEGRVMIVLPLNANKEYINIRIEGNKLTTNSKATLIKSVATAPLQKVFVFGNYGNIDDPNHTITSVSIDGFNAFYKSHNHEIANINGLQAKLNELASGSGNKKFELIQEYTFTASDVQTGKKRIDIYADLLDVIVNVHVPPAGVTAQAYINVYANNAGTVNQICAGYVVEGLRTSAHSYFHLRGKIDGGFADITSSQTAAATPCNDDKFEARGGNYQKADFFTRIIFHNIKAAFPEGTKIEVYGIRK